MRRHLKIITVFSLLAFTLTGCSAIRGLFNPFAGKWKSGIFELEFRGDDSFKFVMGSTVSINLEGKYSYDDESLALNFDSGSAVVFSYEFKDNKKKLVLIPQTDFDYIKTKLEFTKE